MLRLLIITGITHRAFASLLPQQSTVTVYLVTLKIKLGSAVAHGPAVGEGCNPIHAFNAGNETDLVTATLCPGGQPIEKGYPPSLLGCLLKQVQISTYVSSR